MNKFHDEYNALSVVVCNDMTFTEFYELKTKGGHRRKYDERKDIC